MKIEEIASRLATIKKSLQATDLHTLTLRAEEVEKLLEEYTSQLTDSNELPRDDRMVIEILNKIVIHSKKCRDTEVGHGVVVALANECLILLNEKHDLLASKDARIRELEQELRLERFQEDDSHLYDDEDDHFVQCDDCKQPDACRDFGCYKDELTPPKN